jgi:hypothetical protein
VVGDFTTDTLPGVDPVDLASVLLIVAVTLLGATAVLGVAGYLLLRRMRALLPTGAGATTLPAGELDEAPPMRGLTVLQDNAPSRTCAACRHFNVDAGQRLMRSQPAFFQATAHLEPWQMARQRKVAANPEYDRVEALMHAAQEAGEVEEARALHDRLLELDPGTVEDDVDQLDEAMMNATWQDAGLCAKHRELRFGPDTCESWSER